MHDLPTEDADLLRYYAAGSEAAFRELVRRHLGMVHGTARRILAPAPHLAEDVTQNVFTDLAKQAPSLPAGVVLGGWLHRHTCYLALNTARAEHRRRARERTAMEINAVNENSGPDAPWVQLAPVLDDALNQLEPADRDALVLRYLEQRDLRSVGRALGSSEDAAQKRVTRALEKLRGLLVRSGVTVGSAAALGTTLEASPAAVVAPEWAATISDLALSGAAAMSILTLILTSLKTMITSKLVQGLAAVVALVGITVAILAHRAPTPLSTGALVNVSAPTVNPATPLLAANQVEPPKVPPATPVATLPDVTPSPAAAADPQADLKTVIPYIVRLYRDNDLVTFWQTFTPPDEWAKIGPQTIQGIQEADQQMAALGINPEFISNPTAQDAAQAWEALEDQTPTYNAAGDEATYLFTYPTAHGGGLGIQATQTLIKINGRWYIKSVDAGNSSVPAPPPPPAPGRSP